MQFQQNPRELPHAGHRTRRARCRSRRVAHISAPPCASPAPLTHWRWALTSAIPPTRAFARPADENPIAATIVLTSKVLLPKRLSTHDSRMKLKVATERMVSVCDQTFRRILISTLSTRLLMRNHNRINVFAKRATGMSSEYPVLDQNSAADPVLGTRMESRLAPRSNSRRSASVTSCAAIPFRLPSGATASLYRFPRQPSQAAITVATILPPISATISASLSLSRRQAILSELSVSLGSAPDNCQSSSIGTASSRRPLRMLTASPTLRATFLHNILRICDRRYARSMTGNSWLVRALIGDAPRVVRER